MIYENAFLGVPTTKKLTITELKRHAPISYCIPTERNLGLKVGDVITASNSDSPIQVVSLLPDKTVKDSKVLLNTSINGVSIDFGSVTRPVVNKVTTKQPTKALVQKENKMSTNNKMITGLMDRYKSQFFPEKEENIKISIDGAMCVNVNGEYIGVKSDGSLTNYLEEFLIDFPVYSISKPQSQVKVGDIIKTGRNYGRVTKRNDNGSLEVLYFSGVTGNTQEIKDMLLGQSMVRVLVNMFNFNENSGINPLMFLAMSDKQDFDAKTLLLMQMVNGGQGLTGSSENGFNPLMFLLLGDKEDSKSDTLSTILMMQMLGGKSPFSAIAPNTTV